MMTICEPPAPAVSPLDLPAEVNIRNQVLHRIGTPPGLIKVDAVNVFGDRWRVNVWCKVQRLVSDTSGMARGLVKRLVVDNGITHSFFVKADAAGLILESDPPLPT